jgi:hypothetical protein
LAEPKPPFTYMPGLRDTDLPWLSRGICARRRGQRLCTLLKEGASSIPVPQDRRPQAETAWSCKEPLRLKRAMWPFPLLEGIPLAINAEEYVLGPAVIWRKLSRVTQSENCRAFMARMLTVVMTLRARGRNALESTMATYEAVRKSARVHALWLKLIEPQQDEPLIAT